MSEVNLLAFGCAVSFVTLAGAYAYVRDAFTAREQSRKAKVVPVEVGRAKPRDAA